MTTKSLSSSQVSTTDGDVFQWLFFVQTTAQNTKGIQFSAMEDRENEKILWNSKIWSLFKNKKTASSFLKEQTHHFIYENIGHKITAN